MTDTEFLDRFDVLFNNIASNQAPGLNVYEVCVFLTKAQEEILKNYFNPKGNKYGEGFDGNQKRQIDFSSITRVHNYSEEGENVGTVFGEALYDTRDESKSVALPSDVWIIVNERVMVKRGGKEQRLTVKPISFEEYDRLMSKPYKRPLRHQAWRLINSEVTEDVFEPVSKSDLIVGPNDDITGYSIRYIHRPKPVIVGSLDGLTLNGYCYIGDETPTGKKDEEDKDINYPETSGCELDPILHEEILQRALELAKVAWTQIGQDNAQAVMQSGQRSE